MESIYTQLTYTRLDGMAIEGHYIDIRVLIQFVLISSK